MRRRAVRESASCVGVRARSIVCARILETSSHDAAQADGEREDGGDEDGDDGDDGGLGQLQVAEALSRGSDQWHSG